MLLLVGQMVERVFRELERENPKCTVTWFAGQLNCDRRNVYDIFKRATIDSQLLEQISYVLRHNFFDDVAAKVAEELKRRRSMGMTQFMRSGGNSTVYFLNDDGSEAQCFDYSDLLTRCALTEYHLAELVIKDSIGEKSS